MPAAAALGSQPCSSVSIDAGEIGSMAFTSPSTASTSST
jgi:hypothetical protein